MNFQEQDERTSRYDGDHKGYDESRSKWQKDEDSFKRYCEKNEMYQSKEKSENYVGGTNMYRYSPKRFDSRPRSGNDDVYRRYGDKPRDKDSKSKDMSNDSKDSTIRKPTCQIHRSKPQNQCCCCTNMNHIPMVNPHPSMMPYFMPRSQYSHSHGRPRLPFYNPQRQYSFTPRTYDRTTYQGYRGARGYPSNHFSSFPPRE